MRRSARGYVLVYHNARTGYVVSQPYALEKMAIAEAEALSRPGSYGGEVRVGERVDGRVIEVGRARNGRFTRAANRDSSASRKADVAKVELYNLWTKGSRFPKNGWYVAAYERTPGVGTGFRRLHTLKDFKLDEAGARGYAEAWNRGQLARDASRDRRSSWTDEDLLRRGALEVERLYDYGLMRKPDVARWTRLSAKRTGRVYQATYVEGPVHDHLRLRRREDAEDKLYAREAGYWRRR